MKKHLFVAVLTILMGKCYAQNPVAENGKLQVIGHQLCNEKGQPFQLTGMSMFALMHLPQCITYDGFKVLKEDWNCNVLRTPIYISNYSNNRNYNQSPDWNNQMIDSIVNWSEKLGVYCIIDWHVNDPVGNPCDPIYDRSDAFFELMSTKYAGKKHVIYELCNEPSGNAVTWDSISTYANRIIPIIRKNDPKSLIIVGTPNWSQKLETVNVSKLKDSKNVMYAFHFYAKSHAVLYSGFVSQIHRIPVFVTEWGTCESSGAGGIDTATSNLFIRAMNRHVSNKDTVYISWCNFSYGDKNESASSLVPNSCDNKLWNNTTTDGDFIKYWLIHKKAPDFTGIENIPHDKDLYQLFPNPASSSIAISTSSANKISISVKDVMGNEVVSAQTFEKNTSLDVSSLSAGNYFVVLKEEGKTEYKMFTKN